MRPWLERDGLLIQVEPSDLAKSELVRVYEAVAACVRGASRVKSQCMREFVSD